MRIIAVFITVLSLALAGMAQDKGSITGRIVDEKGKGIEGAMARAINAAGDEAASIAAGPRGEFKLEVAPGAYVLEFEAAGHSSATLRDKLTVVAGKETRVKRKVELPHLDKGSVVRGSVFTSDGRSLPRAKVRLERVPLQAGGSVPAFVLEAVSDRIGMFSFSVPEGEYRYRLTATKDGYTAQSTTVDVAGGETLNVSLKLPQAR